VIVLSVTLAAALTAAATLLVLQRRPPSSPDRILAAQVRRGCVIASKSGDTYRGVLMDADDRSVFLAHAFVDESPMDGEVLILRADIAFVQLL
jgi:hypothetical protein